MQQFKIEYIPLALNIVITGWYMVQAVGGHPDVFGRCLYWCGATLVTTGLLFMKG